MDVSALRYSLLIIVATTTAKDAHQAPIVHDENGALGSAIEGATPTHLAAPEANHRRRLWSHPNYDHHARSCVKLGMGYAPIVVRGDGIQMPLMSDPVVLTTDVVSRDLAKNIDLWNTVYPPGWDYTMPGAGTMLHHPVRPFLEEDSQTPAECSALCDANNDCKGFEYGVNYGGYPAEKSFPAGYLVLVGSWSLCVERLSVIGCGCVSSRSTSTSVFIPPPCVLVLRVRII